ncbi:MAG TPA: gamma-glutamyltransferase [Candidatus Limnocylindrales bacterium]|nr:gamma-glutamyltransferase [Candidatus Limnocylindrales bacterium]
MLVPPGVAAGHPATTDVGIQVLRMGGTAADAAVAATFAACAAETIFTGLTGGGFATYYDASTGEVTCLDFFCAVPGLDGELAGPMHPIAVRFGEVPIPYEIGGASVAVPGLTAGCGEIHQRWGRLPWTDVVGPAKGLARDGVPIPDAQARCLPMLVEAMLLDQGTVAYAPGGALLAGGERLFHQGLAGALELLAKHGPSTLYEGELGSLMIHAVRADGGAMSMTDLASYRVIERKVVHAEFSDLMVFGRHDLNQTVATIGSLPESFPLMPLDERAVQLVKTISGGAPDGLGDTTNVTAVDADGNACVITTTLGLGAGVWLPGYGVHLNSMLGEGELNVAEPVAGERIGSMMCPLVVLDSDGALRLALGSAGASRIRSALMQTLIHVVVDKMPVREAVHAPRLHAVDGLVHIEPGFPQEQTQAIADAGFEVKRWTHRHHHYFGGVSAVGSSGCGADPRRDGAAALL